MIKQINLREISRSDRFAPDEEYAIRKAQIAVILRPFVYRIEGDILFADTSKMGVSVDHLRQCLAWGYQWNGKEM